MFFAWYPLFSNPAPSSQHDDDLTLPGNLPQTTPSVLPDLQYERASILINIAATYARMAVAEDRSSLEGNKKAMSHFSVSVFSFLLTESARSLTITFIDQLIARCWSAGLRSRFCSSPDSTFCGRPRSSITGPISRNTFGSHVVLSRPSARVRLPESSSRQA